jgi:hypothetical protein
MSNIFICQICNKEFKSKKSLSCHKNHHNPEYRKKALEGSAALKTEKAEKARKQTFTKKKMIRWEKENIKECIICKSKLEFPQKKTCSDECYKKYRSNANKRPMTEQRRKNIKDAVSNYYKDIPKKAKKCKNCNKELPIGFQESYCNDTCVSEAKTKTSKKLSNSLKKAFQEGRHLGNEYRNRKNKSFLERSFIDYLGRYFPEVEYEFNKIIRITDENNNFIRNYFIDFYFPNQNIGIELDGIQHEQSKEYDTNRDIIIEKTYNIPIIRISYKEYFDKTKKKEIDSILSMKN